MKDAEAAWQARPAPTTYYPCSDCHALNDTICKCARSSFIVQYVADRRKQETIRGDARGNRESKTRPVVYEALGDCVICTLPAIATLACNMMYRTNDVFKKDGGATHLNVLVCQDHQDFLKRAMEDAKDSIDLNATISIYRKQCSQHKRKKRNDDDSSPSSSSSSSSSTPM